MTPLQEAIARVRKARSEYGDEYHALALILTTAEEAEGLRAALIAAEAALRSYQYGNSAPDLAEEVANNARRALTTGREGIIVTAPGPQQRFIMGGMPDEDYKP